MSIAVSGSWQKIREVPKILRISVFVSRLSYTTLNLRARK